MTERSARTLAILAWPLLAACLILWFMAENWGWLNGALGLLNEVEAAKAMADFGPEPEKQTEYFGSAVWGLLPLLTSYQSWLRVAFGLLRLGVAVALGNGWTALAALAGLGLIWWRMPTAEAAETPNSTQELEENIRRSVDTHPQLLTDTLAGVRRTAAVSAPLTEAEITFLVLRGVIKAPASWWRQRAGLAEQESPISELETLARDSGLKPSVSVLKLEGRIFERTPLTPAQLAELASRRSAGWESLLEWLRANGSYTLLLLGVGPALARWFSQRAADCRERERTEAARGAALALLAWSNARWAEDQRNRSTRNFAEVQVWMQPSNPLPPRTPEELGNVRRSGVAFISSPNSASFSSNPGGREQIRRQRADLRRRLGGLRRARILFRRRGCALSIIPRLLAADQQRGFGPEDTAVAAPPLSPTRRLEALQVVLDHETRVTNRQYDALSAEYTRVESVYRAKQKRVSFNLEDEHRRKLIQRNRRLLRGPEGLKAWFDPFGVAYNIYKWVYHLSQHRKVFLNHWWEHRRWWLLGGTFGLFSVFCSPLVYSTVGPPLGYAVSPLLGLSWWAKLSLAGAVTAYAGSRSWLPAPVQDWFNGGMARIRKTLEQAKKQFRNPLGRSRVPKAPQPWSGRTRMARAAGVTGIGLSLHILGRNRGAQAHRRVAEERLGGQRLGGQRDEGDSGPGPRRQLRPSPLLVQRQRLVPEEQRVLAQEGAVLLPSGTIIFPEGTIIVADGMLSEKGPEEVERLRREDADQKLKRWLAEEYCLNVHGAIAGRKRRGLPERGRVLAWIPASENPCFHPTAPKVRPSPATGPVRWLTEILGLRWTSLWGRRKGRSSSCTKHRQPADQPGRGEHASKGRSGESPPGGQPFSGG